MGAQTLAHVQGHVVAVEAPQEGRASGRPQRHSTLPHHVNAAHVPEASTHTRPGPGLRGARCHSSVNQTVSGRTCLGTSRRHEKSRRKALIMGRRQVVAWSKGITDPENMQTPRQEACQKGSSLHVVVPHVIL